MGSLFSKTDSSGREKVKCELCGQYHHRLDVHLPAKHGMSVKDYVEKFPGAPTISEAASAKAREAQKAAVAKRKEIAEEKRLERGEIAETKKDEGGAEVIKIGNVALTAREGLSEADKARVPEYDEHWVPAKILKEQMECLALGVLNVENVYMYGPTGCGKTSLVDQLAAMLHQPTVRIQANQKLTVEDFVGQNALEPKEGMPHPVTVWKDGVLPQAMRGGWWLIIDEFCGADAGVFLRLQAVLEGKPLILTENGGEVVRPHPNFRIIATDNTNGHGDDSGKYTGLKVMNEATMDRFGVMIKSDYPDKETEIKIMIERTGIDIDIARKMAEVSQRVREAEANEQCYCSFSTRRLVSWAKKTTQLKDVRRAGRIAVTNKLTPDDSKFVEGLIQRYFGGEV